MGDTAINRIFRSPDEINFYLIVGSVVGAWLLITVIGRFLPWLANRLPGAARYRILPWVPVFRLIIVTVAIFNVVSQLIRPTTENLVATGGALGVGLGFALKDYISDLLAGIVAIYERPYRVGDWIRIGDAYGEVNSIGFRSIRMVTPGDDAVTIPHSKIWQQSIFNSNDGRATQQVAADFYAHPNHDAVAAKARLYDVGLTSAYLNMSKPIAVIVQETSVGTHYRLKAYPRDLRAQFEFMTDLTVRGKAALLEMKIQLVSMPVTMTNAGGPK